MDISGPLAPELPQVLWLLALRSPRGQLAVATNWGVLSVGTRALRFEDYTGVLHFCKLPTISRQCLIVAAFLLPCSIGR